MNKFTVKVKYTRQMENGTFKRVSEPYLVEGHSFTDAEASIYEQLGNIIRGEFVVTNIQRTDFHDIFFYEDSDLWFKLKIKYMSQDADSEKSKKISQNFLLNAKDSKQAYERLKESLSTLMVDFDITSIAESPIVDIFINADNDISKADLNFKVVEYNIGKPDFEDEDEDEDEMEDSYGSASSGSGAV